MTAFRQPHFNYTKYETAPSCCVCEPHSPPSLSFSLCSLSAHSYQWSYCQSLTHTHTHTEHSPNKNLETQQMPKQKYIALCVCVPKHFDSANHAHCTFMQTPTSTATLTALLRHCNQCAALIAKFFKWFFAQPFCLLPSSPFLLAVLVFLFGSRQREERGRQVQGVRVPTQSWTNFEISS